MKSGPKANRSVLRSVVRQILLGASIAALAHAASADQLSREVEFRISSQRLAAGLSEFADQAGVQIISSGTDVDHIVTPGVTGKYSAQQALEALLRGTGLRFRVIDEHTIAIQSSEGAADNAQQSALLRVASGGEPATPAADGVNEVVVQGLRFAYKDQVMSAMKMPLSVKDTPQTVLVVTSDLMEFASIRQFSDIYKLDASGGVAHAGDQVPRNYYRGFRQQSINSIKVDGFRMTGRTNLDLASFDRFEVIKGATSTLYGQNSIAGTLNAISKMPQARAGGELSFETGSYQHYRADLDLYGPIGSSDRLSYRFIGAYLDEDNALDFAYSKHYVVAPAVRYEFESGTTLTARATYQNSEFPYYFGYGPQFLGDPDALFSDVSQFTRDHFRVPDVPKSRTGAMPWNKTKRAALFEQITVEHPFANDWQLRGNVQYNHVTEYHNSANAWVSFDDTFAYVTAYSNNDDDTAYGAEVNLFGDVELFGRKHTLFFGADYARLDNAEVHTTQFYEPSAGFSIVNPDYSTIPEHRHWIDYDRLRQSADLTISSGITAQMLLHPADGWTVSLGARYASEKLDSRSIFSDAKEPPPPLGPTERINDSKVTKQAGVTYAVTPETNLYASYGETFEPQNVPLQSGERSPPEEGRAYELGAKGNLFGRQLAWSVAAFDMERSNISQQVQGQAYYILAGVQRSRGVEFEMQADLQSGWNLFGSLAYLDAEYIDGEYRGVRPVNAPRFGASLYASYEIKAGSLQGLGFGGGVVHKAGFTDRTLFSVDGVSHVAHFGLSDDFTEVDARAFYSRNHWHYQIGVTNLFDTVYYTQHADGLLNPYLINPRRSIIGKVTYRFR